MRNFDQRMSDQSIFLQMIRFVFRHDSNNPEPQTDVNFGGKRWDLHHEQTIETAASRRSRIEGEIASNIL